MSYRKDEDKTRRSSIRSSIGTIDELRHFELSKKETNEEILKRLMIFAKRYQKHFDKFTMNTIQAQQSQGRSK